MITYVPGIGPVDDSIPAGQPGGPPAIAPASSNSPTTVDPADQLAVSFNDTAPGVPVNPIDTTDTPV
jgi:hypothetical protein